MSRGMVRRVFLNRPSHNSIAMIYARVAKGSVELKIADCDRVVSLDFGDYDAAERENSLYKIDRLVDVLSQFRDALHKKMDKKANA
jgi:hypothetical protein